MSDGTNCISDSQYVDAARTQRRHLIQQATLEAGLITAMGLWQRFSGKTIADMQNEEADKALGLAEELLDHSDKFKPYERRIVEEAFAMKKNKPKYKATAKIFASVSGRALDIGKEEWIKSQSGRCKPIDLCMEARWDRETKLNEVDAGNFGLRVEESRSVALNDRAFSIKYAALGLSKGALTNILTFQDAQFTAAGNLAQAFTSGINTLVQAAGYWNARRDHVKHEEAINIKPAEYKVVVEDTNIYTQNLAVAQSNPTTIYDKSVTKKRTK